MEKKELNLRERYERGLDRGIDWLTNWDSRGWPGKTVIVIGAVSCAWLYRGVVMVVGMVYALVGVLRDWIARRRRPR